MNQVTTLFMSSRKAFIVFAAIIGLIGGFIIFPAFSSLPAHADPSLEAGGTIEVSDPPPVLNPGGQNGGTGIGTGNGGGTVPPPPYVNTQTFYARGVYQDNVSKIFATGRSPMAVTCPPRGDGASAYAVSITFWEGLTAFGSRTVIILRYTCLYPTSESLQPVVYGSITCYYNFSGHYAYSDNKPTIAGSGTVLGYRPSLASDPTTPGFSRDSGPSGCNTNSNRVWWQTAAGEYGYYRISADLNYRTYTQWGWPSWMQRSETWWEAGGQHGANFTNYYVYSCSATNAAFEGPMQHYQLPETGQRQFDVNQCPQVNWQCTVDGNPNINTPWDAPTTIMRDGNKVNVYLPGMKIDGSGVRNFNGTNTGVSDNDMQYLTSVSPGSTPMNGTDLNGGRQYFKLFKTSGASEKFDTWYSNPNANRNKQMEFYWASTSPSQAFSLTWNARFKAQFLVPRSDTVGGGTSLQWVGDNATCPNLPITGNKASVVRSTASQSDLIG